MNRRLSKMEQAVRGPEEEPLIYVFFGDRQILKHDIDDHGNIEIYDFDRLILALPPGPEAKQLKIKFGGEV